MHSQLFDHVDIEKGNINIPDGTIDRNEIEHYCEQYESRIEQCGGIDLQLLGIGGTGHIGFNEPGSSIKSKTRIITLDRKTRSDASSSFFGIENVPKYAITMGVGTILKAKEIVIMAFTEGKANIAQRVIEGDVSAQYPATYLQQHGKTTFVLEQASATKLARNLTPWLIQGLKGEVSIEYNIRLTKKAVIWLSHRTNKPILRLTNQDFEENNLIDLVTQVGKGNSGLVDLVVFNSLKSIITGWPGGGRPDMDPESYTSHRKSTTPQRVVIFSPHPDDDVICMGGTMAKLVN
jgi:glucosamine-6-phosphate deaminase